MTSRFYTKLSPTVASLEGKSVFMYSYPYSFYFHRSSTISSDHSQILNLSLIKSITLLPLQPRILTLYPMLRWLSIQPAPKVQGHIPPLLSKDFISTIFLTPITNATLYTKISTHLPSQMASKAWGLTSHPVSKT
jgi:hypothetical protein